jgi:hypothetical protein
VDANREFAFRGPICIGVFSGLAVSHRPRRRQHFRVLPHRLRRSFLLVRWVAVSSVRSQAPTTEA